MVEAERLQEQSGHEAGRSQSRGRRPSPGGHNGVPQPRRSWSLGGWPRLMVKSYESHRALRLNMLNHDG